MKRRVKAVLAIGFAIFIVMYVRLNVGYFGGTGTCRCDYKFTFNSFGNMCFNLCEPQPQMTTKQKIINAILLKPESLLFDTKKHK